MDGGLSAQTRMAARAPRRSIETETPSLSLRLRFAAAPMREPCYSSICQGNIECLSSTIVKRASRVAP